MIVACNQTCGKGLHVTYSCMGLVHPHSQSILDMLHRQILPYALQLLACILVICMLAQTERVSLAESSRMHLRGPRPFYG